ncbi:DUF4424 family protein [Neisseria sp. P0012.S006]|jgi:hypothetical protein|uniref:DUF4424 family protein n=1 Tax=Neisseria TaxID=482 RepID=UPI0008A455E8|nr:MULTISPECIES: DUF4424 family protein [Neisseria]OFQ13096.1 hypothetical protein HMPREF2952_08355 [Neisseria sp. HMSC068C12]
MKQKALILLLLLTGAAHANDSMGTVSTSGIKYLKNPHIDMQSEDLHISEKQIRVHYKFKNTTAKDITETVLFPLPIVPAATVSDFADTKGLVDSFRIYADGKPVRPQAHVRAYFERRNGSLVDVTADLKKCGLSDQELMHPWTKKQDGEKIGSKIGACRSAKVQSMLPKQTDELPDWSSQIIYSWKQTFKANSVTEIKHQYTPLVGGSFLPSLKAKDSKAFIDEYCMDENFLKNFKNVKGGSKVYHHLGYVLTTGANWAKPIGKFTLTIDREPNTVLSLCWDKSLRKVGQNRFQAVKENFLPKKDLDIIFVYD